MRLSLPRTEKIITEKLFLFRHPIGNHKRSLVSCVPFQLHVIPITLERLCARSVWGLLERNVGSILFYIQKYSANSKTHSLPFLAIRSVGGIQAKTFFALHVKPHNPRANVPHTCRLQSMHRYTTRYNMLEMGDKYYTASWRDRIFSSQVAALRRSRLSWLSLFCFGT